MTLSAQQRSRIRYVDGSSLEHVERTFLTDLRDLAPYLFHATYSLSETTLPAREKLTLDLVAESSQFLIVFQDTFSDTMDGSLIDNVAWFDGPFKKLVPEHAVRCEPLPHHEGSHVIFGSRSRT